MFRSDATPNPSVVTLYQGAIDEHPKPFAVNGFDDLVRGIFSQHRDFGAPNKKGKTPVFSPAFSPAEFDGLGREQDNVVRVHFGVLDVDGIHENDFRGILEKLKNFRYVTYSTYSHGFKPCRHDHTVYGVCARVVFCFDRTVHIKEWPVFWRGLNEWIGKGFDGKDLIDPATKNADRLYFLPGTRSPDAPRFLVGNVGSNDENNVLPVDKIIEIGKTIKEVAKSKGANDPTNRSSITELTLLHLSDLSTTLKRKRSAALTEIGNAIDAVVEGRIYAPPGERDLMLFKITGQITRFFRNADPERTAQLFRRSFETTNAAAGEGSADEDIGKLIEKLERQKKKLDDDEEEQAADDNAQKRFALREAWISVGEDRDTNYTVDEIMLWRRDLGITRDYVKGEDILSRRWILTRGKTAYVFVGGRYLKPIEINDLALSVRRDLSPAEPFGVVFERYNEKQDVMVKKSIEDIINEYGTVARGSVVDLNAQITRYDAKEQIIYEAPCPLRPLDALGDQRIDQWLFLLAGEDEAQYHRLRAWVAFASDLSKPCVALYLDGPGGVGKSLFAKAMARLWTTRSPTTLSQATALFNDRLVYCPLIFADEKMPRNFLDEGTALVREFQQNTDRDIQRKHLASSPMIGAVRLIMASNNKHMMDTKEMLTEVDIEAITERILYVNASPKARQFLIDNFSSPDEIIEGDLLAKHSLWLRQNKIYNPQGRFLIPLDSSALTRSLTTSSGIRAQLCQWIVGYLQKPTKYDAVGEHLIHIRNGELLVNAQAILDRWELYLPTIKNVPSVTSIATGLRGLVKKGRKQVRIRGEQVDFRIVDIDALVAWSEDTGVSSEEQITGALKTDTPIDGRRAVSAMPVYTKTNSR